MTIWELVLDVVGVLLVLLVCYFLGLVVRRRLIGRDGGTFELSHRVRAGRPGRGWLLGIGRYSGETLEWFRFFSISPRPRRRWERRRMSYVSSHEPDGVERMSLYADHVVVICEYAGQRIELAMAESSLTGFQAWLESRPPGTDWSRR
ncbi:MAG TPA: DUF2550 domain-containing protein [Nocardioides sp.]|uniref:DUF2550 domain-containing protein n=1 Tax=Nocardioides sp. TaxID=35761 RepID=UPI002EDB3D03